MVERWYWEFKTITGLSHRLESVMRANFTLQKKLVKGNFFFFLPSISSFPWPGKPLELASIQVLLPKVATRSVCSFCSAIFDGRCGGRHASCVCQFPSAGLPTPCPLCAVCWVSHVHSVAWAGLWWSGAEASNHPLHKNQCVGHILPTLPIFQELPQLPLVAVCRRALALPGFEPFFSLVGGPRKHEQCLCCTSPVLSVVSVGWVNTWHLYYAVKIT